MFPLLCLFIMRETALPDMLDHLQELQPKPLEILIVDAMSTDATLKKAAPYHVRVIQSEQKGRAAQMHWGALHAKGDYLCFLHADTYAPLDLVSIIQEGVLNNGRTVLAAFVALMKGKRVRYWFSFLNYLKTYAAPLFYRPYHFAFKGLRLLFGDQVMFCRKKDYFLSGGFDPNASIMEEADFCLKMNKLGRIRQIHRRVYSSDRRVKAWGFWKANRIYFYIAIAWAFTNHPNKLKRYYGDIR